MLGHKLKPVGDAARILNIDSSPMSGDIYDATSDAQPTGAYLRGVLNSCPFPILGHDTIPAAELGQRGSGMTSTRIRTVTDRMSAVATVCTSSIE
jgi:hypothetical protein